MALRQGYESSTKYPGALVDDVGRDIAGAVKGVISSVEGGLQNAGERLQSGLDRPAKMIGVQWGPFRIIHDPASAVVSIVGNGVTGVVETVETMADGLTSGLDRVPDAFNAPPVPDLTQPGFTLRDRRRR
jgi:hypothetical protein